MTKKEFEKRMSVLNEKQDAIRQEMVKLQEDYISNYPAKPGDKCVDEQGKICWVIDMRFWEASSTWMRILVNPAKKDGTRSKCEKYAYGEITKKQENK